MGRNDIVTATKYAVKNVGDHAASVIEEKRTLPNACRRVVAIPGYFQHGIGPYRELREKFRKHDRIEIIPSDTYFWKDLKESAHYIADKIIHMNGNGKVIDALVGHSMGGLIACLVAQMPEIKDRIRNVICVATPHQGTNIAFLGMATKSARQMLPVRYEVTLTGRKIIFRNRFLEELQDGEYSQKTRVINIYGTKDRIAPPESSSLPSADKNIPVDTGHFEILYHPQVHEEIRKNVLRK